MRVAWANGVVSRRERESILDAAAARGVAPGSPAHALLLDWLAKPPPEELCDAALDVLRVGISVLPPEEREQRVRDYAASFRSVARTSTSGIREAIGGRDVPREVDELIERMAAALRR